MCILWMFFTSTDACKLVCIPWMFFTSTDACKRVCIPRMFLSLCHSRFFSDLKQNYITVLNYLKFHTLSIWGRHLESPFSPNASGASKFFIPLDNDQLDTHLLYFTIRLLQSSTCFEHYMLIIRRLNCIDAASGIVTLSKWPSGAQVLS